LAVTLEQSDQGCTVRLEGEINIGVAAELKKVLIEALKSKKPVRIEFEGATGVGVTGVQLLWAAEREAERAGVKFARMAGMPQAIAAAVAEAGLEFPMMMAAEPAATA
jgi:anti-anti-sigma regulatory factor